MKPVEKHNGSEHILFDGDALSDIHGMDFEPTILAVKGQLVGEAQGRGTTYFIELNSNACVLRHYRRGGLMAGVLGDRYWGTDIPSTRAWREWHLLADLSAKQLPVPAPLAARVTTHGLYYTADLITARIPKAESLSQVLQESSLTHEQWQQVGSTIRHIHNAGADHADLNAHNILLDHDGNFYVLDFDKGQLRPPNRTWQFSNLARLQRSLNKLQNLSNQFHFTELDWEQLMEGWQAGSKA